MKLWRATLPLLAAIAGGRYRRTPGAREFLKQALVYEEAPNVTLAALCAATSRAHIPPICISISTPDIAIRESAAASSRATSPTCAGMTFPGFICSAAPIQSNSTGDWDFEIWRPLNLTVL